MKILLLSVASLSTLVAAQPHARHQHRRVQRDLVTEEYVVEAPVKVVVYVNPDGTPLSTTTVGLEQTSTSVAISVSTGAVAPPVAEEPKAQDQPQPDQEAEIVEASYEAKEPAPETHDAPKKEEPAAEQPASPEPQQQQEAPPAPQSEAEQSPPPTPDSGSGSGITYTPYNDDDSCKTDTEVKSDFEKITGYSFVRLYGTNCNQLDTVLPAARGRGMKVFAGIDNRNLTSPMIKEEVEYLARASNGDWSIYSTISVGNEVVQHGGDAGAVISAVNEARSLLRAKGYNGPVVTVDTVGAMRGNPGLCEASDYAACNVHAFFNGGIGAADAGKFVANEVKMVADEICPGKKVVVTETGWPSQGSPNKEAVPSPENQSAAIKSIADAFASDPAGVVYFSAFDEGWKKDRGDTFGCEKFYGILHR